MPGEAAEALPKTKLPEDALPPSDARIRETISFCGIPKEAIDEIGGWYFFNHGGRGRVLHVTPAEGVVLKTFTKPLVPDNLVPVRDKYRKIKEEEERGKEEEFEAVEEPGELLASILPQRLKTDPRTDILVDGPALSRTIPVALGLVVLPEDALLEMKGRRTGEALYVQITEKEQ